jgi:heat shock protein HspQ
MEGSTMTSKTQTSKFTVGQSVKTRISAPHPAAFAGTIVVVDNAFMPTVLAHKAAHVPQSPKARVALRTWIDESFENGKR